MSVILLDLGNQDHDLQINWWTWRPMVALIDSFTILDEARIEMIGCNGAGVEVSLSAARAISAAIQAQILAKLRPSQRIRFDLSTTDEPKDRLLHYDEPERNYSADYESLAQFTEFCRVCGGFTVM